MRNWEVTPAAGPNVQQSILALIAQVGQSTFSDAVLGQVNQLFPVGSWSVYRTWADQPPVLLFSHSFRRPDVTRKCFLAYQNGIYLQDRSFDAVRSCQQRDNLVLQHLRADEFKNPQHREMIYTRNRVCERLSVTRNEQDGSVTSVNLYGHEDHISYTDRHIGHFEALAPALFAGIERHISLCSEPAFAGSAPGDADNPGASSARLFLEELSAGLPSRELDVCERLLQGMTYDGVAADMQLSRPTVITYRNRAFGRLGINFKNQLFALQAQYQQSKT